MDPWAKLREFTQARIGLGRAGDGLSTSALLEFQLGHARARDAVHSRPDFERVAEELSGLGTIRVTSQAKDRLEYLVRPDLGRQLSDHKLPAGDWDLAIVIADGLSAKAVDDHAAAVGREIVGQLGGWNIAPIVLAQDARVALGDPIALALGARMVVVLIGERPGLTVANSLGLYLTLNPKAGTKDSERNCISNVHEHGLSYSMAAKKLVWLANHARQLGFTGVNLKEGSEVTSLPQHLPPLESR